MNILRVSKQRENSVEVIGGCFVFNSETVEYSEPFDGVISEVKTDFGFQANVIYFLSEPFGEYPTFICNKISEKDIILLGILYFKALRDANEISAFLQLVEILRFEQLITAYNCIPASLCCGAESSGMMPLYTFDFRPVATAMDVCKREPDYLMAEFIIELLFNDIHCNCFFMDNFVLVQEGKSVYSGVYARLHFDADSYVIVGTFERAGFQMMYGELKFDYENFQKIAFFASKRENLNLFIEMELNNSLKLLCAEPIANYSHFAFVNGAITIEEHRIPLESITLSQLSSYNGDRLIALEARDMCIFTHVPSSLLESKLREENITFRYEKFDIGCLIDSICVFYCFSRQNGSSARLFVSNLFESSPGVLNVVGGQVDNVAVLRAVLKQPQPELSVILLSEIRFTEDTFDVFIELVMLQRPSCSICLSDCWISMEHACALVLAVHCKLELQEITVYIEDNENDNIYNDENYQVSLCEVEQRLFFEKICERHDVVCSTRMLEADGLADAIAAEFATGNGGLAEEKLKLLLDMRSEFGGPSRRGMII